MAGIFKILLVFATVFVGGILSYNDLGGLTGIRESFPAFPWLSLFGKGIEDSLFSLFSMVIGVISTQTYVQALFSAKDSATAAAGCVTAALIIQPIMLLNYICLNGWGALVLQHCCCLRLVLFLVLH